MIYAQELLRQRNVRQKDLSTWLDIWESRLSLLFKGGKGGADPTDEEKMKLENFFQLPIETLLSPFKRERTND